MRTLGKMTIPVLASILILCTFVYAPFAEAVSTVIDTDTNGNQKVGHDDSLTIKNGATLSGNIKVDGGTLIVKEGATVDGKVDVKHGGTLTIDNGTVTGNIKVAGGTLVVKEGGTVNGNVDVKKGGVLTIDNSDINGNVKAKGANQVTINNSNIDGNLEVKKTSGASITNNSIDGNLNIKNTSPVIVSGNTVTGNIKVKNSETCNVFDNNANGNNKLGDCSTEPPVLISDLNNLALATSSFSNTAMDGNLIAFTVPEIEQGDQDLNGDGDVSFDRVLHIHDASTGTTTNVGSVAGGVSMGGNLVAFDTTESFQGEDLNGDGDITFARVIQFFDVSTGTTTNTGFETCGVLSAIDGGFIAFPGRERNQGDLNGDGDEFDCVLQLYDSSTGIITNLGIAASGPVFFEGKFVVFSVREASQGDIDLNGNGDTSNTILHTYDISTGSTTNWGLQARVAPLVDGNLIALTVREDSATQDLNGDGDMQDTFAYVIDQSAGIVTQLEDPSSFAFDAITIDGNLVPFIGENVNNSNLSILKIYDANTGTITEVGVPFCGFAFPTTEINLVIFDVCESRVSTDLNNDGDLSDRVLHVFDLNTETLTNLELALSFTSRSGLPFLLFSDDFVVFAVNEVAQGRTDLNGDGDAPFSDASRPDDVMHMFDSSTGVTTNLGLATNTNLPGSGEGNLFYFTLDENEQGRMDTNGDLGFGAILHVLDASTGTTTNLGVNAGTNILANSNFVAFGVAELSSGVKADLNGDGDGNDIVLYTFDGTVPAIDTSAGLTIKTGESITLFESTISGNVVVDGGILVLIKSTVDGDINMTHDGISAVIGSAVNGEVTSQGVKSVSLTVNQITGDVQSTNDKSIAMQLGAINGSVIIHGAQNVVVDDNTIGDQLLVQNNDDVRVVTNSIGNVLKITDNVSCVEGDNTAPDTEIIGCDPLPPPGGGF